MGQASALPQDSAAGNGSLPHLYHVITGQMLDCREAPGNCSGGGKMLSEMRDK